MNFAGKAHTYNDHSAVQQELAEWTAEWLPKDMSGISTLEFGAGTGLFTEHLSRRDADITATDLYDAMIKEGIQRIPSAEWLTADAWNPDISKQQYSYITSSALLQWCPQPEDTLSKWMHLSEGDGRLLSGIIIMGSLDKLNASLPESALIPWRTAEQWQDCVSKAGWKILRAETDIRRFHYSDAFDLFRSIHGTGAVHSNSLNSSQLRRIINKINEKHLSDVGLYENWCFLRIEAGR